jgi:hypothetical protein
LLIAAAERVEKRNLLLKKADVITDSAERV